MSFQNNQNDFMAKKAMTLWMGDLDDGLEEAAISASFLAAGEQVVSVKCIKNRYDGKPAGYAFVEFPSIEASQRYCTCVVIIEIVEMRRNNHVG